MFERIAPQAVRHKDGSIVQSVGRDREEYISEDLKAYIDVDRGLEETAVYPGTLDIYWIAGEPCAMTEELHALIVDRIVAGLEAMGVACIVVEDPAHQDPWPG